MAAVGAVGSVEGAAGARGPGHDAVLIVQAFGAQKPYIGAHRGRRGARCAGAGFD